MKTAESIIREANAAIRLGVDIARAESLRESEQDFISVMPELHTGFYDYIRTGINQLSGITVTNEDMNRVSNPLIPTKLSFMYNMLEHLFSYNCTTDKEVEKRLEDLFEFIKGFEEVAHGVYVKRQDNWVYIVNTNKGITYKKKVKGLKYIGINKEFYYLTGVTGTGEVVVLTDAYMDISKNLYDKKKHKKNNGLWYRTGKKLEKGYVRIQHKKMYFREHLIVIALTYGIEVAKHLVGRNSFLTIDHIDGCEYNNSINNLRVVTRETNGMLQRDNDYDAYDFLDMYKKMQTDYKNFYLI